MLFSGDTNATKKEGLGSLTWKALNCSYEGIFSTFDINKDGKK